MSEDHVETLDSDSENSINPRESFTQTYLASVLMLQESKGDFNIIISIIITRTNRLALILWE